MREFSSFGSFAGHLMRTAAIGEEVTNHITREAAEIVRDDAKRRIGEYQDHVGPFNAWAPLADSTMADRVAKGYSENEPLLREGDLRDSIEEDVRGNEAVVGSVGDIAMYQELGTARIPPRPFLGPGLYDSKNAITEMAAKRMIAWITGQGWKRPRQSIELPYTDASITRDQIVTK